MESETPFSLSSFELVNNKIIFRYYFVFCLFTLKMFPIFAQYPLDLTRSNSVQTLPCAFP